MRNLTVIEAPSILGLRPSGVEDLPTALIQAGLLDQLGLTNADTHTRVEAPPYDPRRDEETGILNAAAIAHFSANLADAVGDALDHDLFPLVLGGDCTILLGNLLALRRRGGRSGRYGLLFLDGHTDFYQPSAEPNGEAASMELALATGRGPRLLTDLEGRGPLVREENVVAFAFRDAAESTQAGMQPLPQTLHAIDLDAVRAWGAEAAAHRALGLLGTAYWIHLDADVLSDDVMPAVDYRLPGGLTWQELEDVLHTALSDERALGLDLTIFNPHLDPDGTLAARLTECLSRTLTARGGQER
ncbi:arginase family protein [Streptomyces luteolifulvus]|jgi:arginase|uniref:Arginase family protein n=1 Tax=Streptomyces luteolifulvus TaxID=2615112 RepID=A0A6H9UY79_9ACTN|nr:arginase family protein [Streptomyces luteolifulvus]KAB1144453.1 arginase family protein [Streptomyces luteolifulvus]